VYAAINGTRIYFDVEGSGLVPHGGAMEEREVCFVLHGGPGMDHSYFKPWLSPLTDTFQLVYVDHRSTGRSDRAPLETCTIEQMADDLEALREYLGLEKVTVLGNSFGGMWALNYAVRHPENLNRLILVTTSASHEFYPAATAEAEKKGTPEQIKVMPDVFEGRIETSEEFAKWWDIMLPLYFYDYDEEIGANQNSRGESNPQVASYMFREVMPKYDVRAQLPSIHVPTLVVSGRHDWVTPVGESEEIARGIPNSQLELFEKSGHMPFIEEQDTFNALVRDFVTKSREA